MRPIAWLRDKCNKLLHAKDAPNAIAVGASVGVFFGFIPLWGVKTLLAIGAARFLRSSLLAAAIGVTLHDVALPLMPLLLRGEYDIGYWLMKSPHELPPHLHLGENVLGAWFYWTTFFTLGRPLMLGAPIVAGVSAIGTYSLISIMLGRSKLPTGSSLAKER